MALPPAVLNATLAGSLLPDITTTEDPLARFLTKDEPYDYKGALLYVFGLCIMYGVSIFLLIISLIRKARGEFEVMDYMRDLEEMRRETRRKNRPPGERTSKLDSLRNLTSKAKITDSLPSITEAFRQYSRPLLLGASTSERHTTIRPKAEIPPTGAYRPRRSSIAIPGMARLVPPMDLGVRRKSDGMVIMPKSPILLDRKVDLVVNAAGESTPILGAFGGNTLQVSPSCSYGTLDEVERFDYRPPVHISLPSPVVSPIFPHRQILYDPMEDRERYRINPKHQRLLGMPLYDPRCRRASTQAPDAYAAARLAVARQETRRNSAFARFSCTYSSIEEGPEVDSRAVSPALHLPDDELMAEAAACGMLMDDDDTEASSTDSDEILPAVTKVWAPGVPKDPIAIYIE